MKIKKYKMKIKKYKLKKDLPDLKAGVIFEHRKYNSKYPDRGNIGSGVMILGWLNGDCQDNWCGETYILPGQLAKNTEWFEKIVAPLTQKELLIKEKKDHLKQINTLNEKVKNLTQIINKISPLVVGNVVQFNFDNKICVGIIHEIYENSADIITAEPHTYKYIPLTNIHIINPKTNV